MVLLFISPSSSGVPATGGARLMARTSVLPNGQNLGAGRIHFARAFKKTGTQTDWSVWALEKPKEMDGETLILN